MKALKTFLVALVVGSAGCAVGPNYRAPRPDEPSHFAATDAGHTAALNGQTTATVDLAQWWKALGDPELDSLVDRAIKSNLDLELALTRLQQARTYESVVTGYALPEVDASAAAGRGTGSDLMRGRAAQPLVSADNTSGLTHINTLAGFDTVWEIDIFGRFRREIEAAHYDTQAAVAARNGVLTSVVADVVRAYVDLRGFQTQLGILRKASEVLRWTGRIASRCRSCRLGPSAREVLGEVGFAALEDEVSERFCRWRECLCQVMHDMPTVHDRQALGLRSGNDMMIEFQSQGVQG